MTTMISAEATVTRVRRDLTLSTMLKVLIIGGALVVFMMRNTMGSVKAMTRNSPNGFSVEAAARSFR